MDYLKIYKHYSNNCMFLRDTALISEKLAVDHFFHWIFFKDVVREIDGIGKIEWWPWFPSVDDLLPDSGWHRLAHGSAFCSQCNMCPFVHNQCCHGSNVAVYECNDSDILFQRF